MEHAFGTGAGPALAQEMNLTFLGHIALRADYQDDSLPTVLASADVKAEYDAIWEGVKARLTDLEAMPEQWKDPTEAEGEEAEKA